VQFKRWKKSNFGDFIEYEIMVQSLEGQRPTWLINKRYTDFVKLHEMLSPFFRLQIQANQKTVSQPPTKLSRASSHYKPISITEQIVPILPPKIAYQSEVDLQKR
jgi:hypothetical protein